MINSMPIFKKLMKPVPSVNGTVECMNTILTLKNLKNIIARNTTSAPMIVVAASCLKPLLSYKHIYMHNTPRVQHQMLDPGR